MRIVTDVLLYIPRCPHSLSLSARLLYSACPAGVRGGKRHPYGNRRCDTVLPNDRPSAAAAASQSPVTGIVPLAASAHRPLDATMSGAPPAHVAGAGAAVGAAAVGGADGGAGGAHGADG